MSDEQQGQPASGAAQQAASLSHDARVSDLTIGQLTAILRGERGRVAAGLPGGLAGAHANSGPPGCKANRKSEAGVMPPATWNWWRCWVRAAAISQSSCWHST